MMATIAIRLIGELNISHARDTGRYGYSLVADMTPLQVKPHMDNLAKNAYDSALNIALWQAGGIAALFDSDTNDR